MVLLIILIVGCAWNKPAVVVPPVEKYCSSPVRPVIERKPAWDIQSLLQVNLIVIDYTLKLEQTIKCWEGKPGK